MKPLAVDLFCGLGGWAEGFLAEGYRVVGFDIEVRPYPAQLVIQDVLTIHGSQFKDAAVIVASPPCQNYSYLAMPWSRSVDWVRPDGDGWEVLNSAAEKEMRQKWEREGPDNRLFDACFRIQREAIEATRSECLKCYGMGWIEMCFRDPDKCEACGGKGFTERYIPLIIENVRGAIPWVGESRANFGSFHLWGDVGMVGKRIVRAEAGFGADGLYGAKFKGGEGSWFAIANNTNGHSQNPVHALTKVPGFRFDGSGKSFQTASVEGMKSNPDGTNRPRGSWFAIADSSQGDRRDKKGRTSADRFAELEGMHGHGRNDAGDDESRSTVGSDGIRDEHSGAQEDGGILAGMGAKGRAGGGWFGDGKNGATRKSDPRDVRKQADGSWMTPDGTKIGGDWFSDPKSTCRKHGSRSKARKAASAEIAKIPLPLSQHIAAVYRPSLAQGLRLEPAAGNERGY